MTAHSAGHIPVLAESIAAFFADSPPPCLVDCTIGLGGHARLLLEAHPKLRLIGLDIDERNLATARQALSSFSGRTDLIKASFADLGDVLASLGVEKVDGILADFGLSSNQIADPARGFSFERDGPLDMRLGTDQTTTAADLVNGLCEGELADLLYLQSQEPGSRRIARRICQVRRQGRINSTMALARIVASALGVNPDAHRKRLHPATRTFLALRMTVNRETDAVASLLSQAPGVLRERGRIAIISFHSGEDRLVKADFRKRSGERIYRILTKRPVVATEQERLANPRSRSAKLRVAERM